MAYEPHAYWPHASQKMTSRPHSRRRRSNSFSRTSPLHPERGAFVDQTLTPAELALYRQPPRLRKDGVPWLDAARAGGAALSAVATGRGPLRPQ